MQHVWGTGGVHRGFGKRPEGKSYLVDIGVDGWIILKCSFKSEMGKHGVDLSGLE